MTKILLGIASFALGFLCNAVIFFYINLRTKKPATDAPVVNMKKKANLPDNKKARQCSTEEYRAEMKWAKINGKR